MLSALALWYIFQILKLQKTTQNIYSLSIQFGCQVDRFCKQINQINIRQPSMIQINVHYVSHSNQQSTDYSKACFCNRSTKSSKVSSRKGSTDIDSKTKFKTEVCKYWSNQIDCPYGENCNFAHGDLLVRGKETLPSKYKTKCCQKFKNEGFCQYGYRCQFIHCPHKQPHVQHSEKLNCLAQDTPMFFSFIQEQERNCGVSHRLKIFEKISTPVNEIIEATQQLEEEKLQSTWEDEYENYVNVRSRHNSAY